MHFTISETQFIASDTHFAGDYKDAVSGIVRPKALTDEQFAAVLPTIIPAGYTKVEIDNSENNAGQSPGARVSYRKLYKKGHGGGEERVEDKYVNIYVGISDESSNMEFTLSDLKEIGQGEKAVKIKGIYEGKERMEKTSSGCGSSGIVFLVNNRFAISLSNDLCDLAVLYQLIDSMNFKNLPK